MKKLTSLVFLILLTASLAAEPNDTSTPIVIGETVTLKSTILGEDRQIMISKPAGYDQSGAKYPVMYLLDGNAHFHHTTGIIQFLSSIGNAPQMLVVGLPNTDRTRDLTPAAPSDTSSQFPTAGGADNFLTFIADELMPFVESNYRTHPYNVLVGHSFGGLFAVNALLTRPDAFDAYVSISPSLWWDNQRLIRDGEAFFKNRRDIDKFFFMTMGNEGDRMLGPANAFATVLEEHAARLNWTFDQMENETHGSIPHRTTYNALEKLFVDWRLPQDIAQTGTLSDFDAHFEALSEKFGYKIMTPELTVNRLGYRLLGEEKTAEAITVLRRNVEQFPESANVYDSLGDAYDAAEQFGLALENYKVAYEKASLTDHPNLQIYKNNYTRLQEKVAGK